MTGRAALIGFLKSTIILAAGAISGIGVYRYSGELKAAPDSPAVATTPRPDGPGSVHALGSIQPKGGVVEVALPAGFRPTRFDDAIARNATVAKGQVIAYLEGYEARLREVAVIEAELLAAEKAIKAEAEDEKMTLAEIDLERQQALDLGKMEQESNDLKIAALNDKALLCRKQFDDVNGLQLNNTISRQQYDQIEAQAKISREELEYARAEARRASAALRLNTGEAKVEQQRRRVRVMADRARSQISIDTLRKKRDLALEQIEGSKVLAPIDGVVLDICTKAGESGAGKPLVKLGDTRRMYVLAEIYEDDRRLVRENQRVEIRGRGLPGDGGEPIVGIVESIVTIIGSHKQSPLDPTSRDNARVYPAWIAIDPIATKPQRKADLDRLREFILQPVEVTILVDDGPTAGR